MLVTFKLIIAWCGHCKKLAPIWEELGEAVKGADLVIAKMDASNNDAEGVEIQGFPTIMLFKKDNSVVTHSGDRTLESFVDFLVANKVYTSNAVKEEDSQVGEL